jgi:5-methylcytosine-specific restriction protein B
VSEASNATQADQMRAAMRSVCEILADNPQGLHVTDIASQVKAAQERRWGQPAVAVTGKTTFESRLRWWSVGLVKAGWITKSGSGIWAITDEGRQALGTFADPTSFGAEVDRLYSVWKHADDAAKAAKKTAEEWALANAVVARIPAGRWATFADVADVLGTYATSLGQHLWVNLPPGWHRVARQGGQLSAEKYGAEDRSDEQRALLAQEGLDAGGALPADRQLSRGDLAGIVAELKGGDRAWFVRGTSVHGASVVPEWIAGDFVSLPASMLPTLDPGADDATIKAAVDSGYSTLGYSQREAKYEEIRTFMRRMRVGDLVLTLSGENVFVGTITGDAIAVASQGKRSNLRRPVDWDDADSPLAIADLSSRMQARISSSSDIIELTDLLSEVQALRSLGEVIGEGGIEPAPAPEGVVLPDLPDDVAERLLIPRAWLDEFVELLREKKQVILYGPPGTGKTYLAQAVAEALGGQGHVTLVQFHPSYSYEDFFEGYRPTGKGDGIALKLVPGPLRKVVDLAQANPNQPYFLIIDEINRANLAKVFGELYFLLEYRNSTIELLYATEDSAQGFTMPDNVYIIGTMNTADRSIALVDAAMRRRFRFLSLHPEDERLDLMLKAWLARENLPDVTDLYLELNRRITDKDIKIGPSYLMSRLVATDAGLERIWRSSILPLLEEYHVGDGIDVKAKYGLPALRSALASAQSSAQAPDPDAGTPDPDVPEA